MEERVRLPGFGVVWCVLMYNHIYGRICNHIYSNIYNIYLSSTRGIYISNKLALCDIRLSVEYGKFSTISLNRPTSGLALNGPFREVVGLGS